MENFDVDKIREALLLKHRAMRDCQRTLFMQMAELSGASMLWGQGTYQRDLSREMNELVKKTEFLEDWIELLETHR